jgi:putative FmdB family regulatory protein
MPTYDYGCGCGKEVEIVHSITETPEIKCPECGKVMERKISAGIGFTFKGGTETMAWKEKRIRHKKQEVLVAKQRERWGGTGPKITPNIAGVEQESWSDCKKLAKECGLDHDSYTPMVEKEKKEKAPKIYTGPV